MYSTQKIVFKAVAFIVVLMIIESQARPTTPTTEDEIPVGSRRISASDRSTTRKRHAEIRLISEIARRMESLRRLAKLNNLMAELDNGDAESVMHNNGRQTQKTRGKRTRNRDNEVFPTAPTHKEISPELLKQLNGQKLTGGVKMRIVHNEQSTRSPSTGEAYLSYIQRAQNLVALAKTCSDMQKMIAENNLRLRIRCQHTPANATTSQ